MLLKKYKNFKIFENTEVSDIESLFYILGDEGYILTLTKSQTKDRSAIEIQINCQNFENYVRLQSL